MKGMWFIENMNLLLAILQEGLLLLIFFIPSTLDNIFINCFHFLDTVFPFKFLQYEFDHFFLQPMDGPRQIQNTALAVEYCEQHQPWEISIQTQKLINVR